MFGTLIRSNLKLTSILFFSWFSDKHRTLNTRLFNDFKLIEGVYEPMAAAIAFYAGSEVDAGSRDNRVILSGLREQIRALRKQVTDDVTPLNEVQYLRLEVARVAVTAINGQISKTLANLTPAPAA